MSDISNISRDTGERNGSRRDAGRGTGTVTCSGLILRSVAKGRKREEGGRKKRRVFSEKGSFLQRYNGVPGTASVVENSLFGRGRGTSLEALWEQVTPVAVEEAEHGTL